MVAMDWMRGLVMVMMAVDHASEEVNAGRVFTDGAFFYQAGTPLPLAQFLTRWMTHLCAPTFVFLAGASLAMSIGRRTAAGESAWAIDRYLLARGLVIAGFELWVSLFWMPPGRVLFQVLYAIGSSLSSWPPCAACPRPRSSPSGSPSSRSGRERPPRSGGAHRPPPPCWRRCSWCRGGMGALFIAYPTLPWLAIMLFGWATGRLLRLATAGGRP